MGRLPSLIAAIAVATVGIAPAAHATVLFSDNFDADNPPNRTNASLLNWNVVSGSVDVVGPGNPWGLHCAGGNCVDMDGSSWRAGRIESKVLITLVTGEYNLTFKVSGNQNRNGATDTLFAGLDFGIDLGDTFILSPSDPFTTKTVSFTHFGTTDARLVFQASGGDNIGPMLDEVTFERVDAVPEPSTLLLLGSTLSGLAGVAWRRRR